MEQVHACLLGEWVNLHDDENCKMGPRMISPSIWWEENAELWSPIQKLEADTMYQQDYIMINYKGKSYRIHPIFIQIVTS
ncbi:TPA: hypothetical protein ACN4VK_000611 [Staphylococcus aureus]|uniref:hypothetical protein n=1 Tax=Staphylococcus aureus TaxID=1280 RepID=UPI0002BA4B3D|nr:hypothetical protein [Staphylococcus aureus]CZQ71740.1 Uncharacterised protein [Staphylococcus aureus]HDG5439727.1 hypothetical protein [Staphylococcus aureus]HDK3732957.1 hypothetical protein [Staphylococcus aureus]HDL0591264.1 hypothetical protein [Staphylococcus aureus]HDR3202981.1 hypothetical protein [Staphylococcus aureus]